MSAWRAVWEVARRELVERSRSRALRVSLVLLLIVAVGGAVAAARLTSGVPTDDVGLVGTRSAALRSAIRLQAQASDRRVHLHRLTSSSSAAHALRDGSIDVALIDGRRILVKTSRKGPAVQVVERAVDARMVVARLRNAGLTQAQALQTLSPPKVRIGVLDPQPASYERNQVLIAVGLMALFGALEFFGQSVAQGVTEEKSSRVVELLLTTLSPRRLLAGKILGVGLLGLALLLIPGATALAAGQLAGGAGLPSAAPEAIALILLWFVLGYVFYSVAFAAVGALVSRQEDLNTAMLPINALLIGAFYLAIVVVNTDPNGTVARVAAFLPPFSPMVVPARVALGDMNALGLAIAIVLELIGTWAMIVLAARAYERAILRIGAPMKLRRLLLGQPRRASVDRGQRAGMQPAGQQRPRPGGDRARLSAGADRTLRGVGALLIVAGALYGFEHAFAIALVATGLLLLLIRSLLGAHVGSGRWPHRPAR